MMRFPGNNVAKNFRLVRRSQYRHCSSMSDKDVQMGDFELLVDNMAGLFFKGAFGVVGFVLGGLTSTGVSEKIQKDEEDLIRLEKLNDENEMKLDLLRKMQLERHRIYSSRNVYTVEGKDTSI
ncbi:unnamed protein product [Arabidopsis halleri]